MGFDQLTEEWVALFNPRIHKWHEHFVWDEDATQMIGISPVGRSTITTLRLNREKLIEYRKSILPLGEHPPH